MKNDFLEARMNFIDRAADIPYKQPTDCPQKTNQQVFDAM